MESESLIRRFYELLRANVLAMILGCSGLISLGYGVTSFSDTSSASNNIVIEQVGDDFESSESILVDVSGAVVKPGVYELESTARISDAIAKAGGMREDADHEHVAKAINLAEPLQDGMKVYIPDMSETIDNSVLADKSGLISINKASSTQLEELPGVGPVTADKIIANRPYASIEDLLEKKSVGSSVFEKIKDQISL